MKPSRISLVFLFVLVGSLLASCTGRPLASSWPGLTVDSGTAYVSYASYVYAINLQNGTMIWRYPDKADAKKVFYAQPAVAGGKVIAGDYGNTVIAINAQDGKESWVFSGPTDRFVGAPSVLDNVIFAPSTDHNLYAVDLQGNQKWVFKTGSPIWAKPVDDGKNLYVASMDRNLYAINPSNGSKLWATDLGAAVMYSLTISQDHSTLYAGTILNELIAVDAASGKIQWRFKTGGNIWSPVVEQDGALYFGDQSGKIYAVSAKDGSKKWEMDAGAPVIGEGAVIGNGLAFPTENNAVVAVDFNGNKLWNQPVNGKLYSNLVYTGDRLVVPVTSGDNNLLLVALKQDGSQVWAFNQPK